MVSLDRLLQIVLDARALGRLQRYLADLRDERGLTQHQLPVTGTAEKTTEVVREAVHLGLLSIEDLANFVDEVEDTGGQHIYLFDYAHGHEDCLVPERVSTIFEGKPRQRPDSFYEELPQDRWFWYQADDAVVVKQVCTAEHWESNVEEDTEDRRVVVWQKRKRRATNSLWASLNPGVQVRIDRVSSGMNNDLAASLLVDFMNAFGNSVNLLTDLLPVPIWRGFRDMTMAKDETYMSVDEAQDPSVQRRISNRRERGLDVRDHHSYDLDSSSYVRPALNIYWRMPWDPAHKVHTILSKVKIGGIAYGKVFINAKITPRELRHVVSRIRHFAN